ncbi:DUF3892 domain-containing protein [Candidatus Dojkabacteria bacterium]|nr:DUF3892 domain-containing protein [Candidatus Dojkabacteria bacterium]
MDYFVIATRKTGGDESEISHYQYNTDKTSYGTIISKANFRNNVNLSTDRFYSLNLARGTQVECLWYKSTNGESFLKSDPNGTEKDNLLELPDC